MPLSKNDYRRILQVIEAICSAGSRDELFKAVFEGLQKLIPFNSAVHVRMDPATAGFQLEGHALHNAPIEHLKLFLEHYQPLHPYGQSRVWKYNINRSVRLTDITPLSKLKETEYFQDFMTLMPAQYELNHMLGSQGDPVGIFGLHRKKGERNFTDREREIMNHILPHLSRTVHNFGLLEAVTDAYGIGIVEVMADRTMRPINDEARRILSQSQGVIPDPGFGVAPAFCKTANGMYRVRSVIVPGQKKTLLLEPVPSWRTIEQALSGYDLTRRQKEIAHMVVSGLPNREIAGALHVTEQTIKDHLRDIFDIIMVRSRTELAAKILGAFAR